MCLLTNPYTGETHDMYQLHLSHGQTRFAVVNRWAFSLLLLLFQDLTEAKMTQIGQQQIELNRQHLTLADIWLLKLVS